VARRGWQPGCLGLAMTCSISRASLEGRSSKVGMAPSKQTSVRSVRRQGCRRVNDRFPLPHLQLEGDLLVGRIGPGVQAGGCHQRSVPFPKIGPIGRFLE